MPRQLVQIGAWPTALATLDGRELREIIGDREPATYDPEFSCERAGTCGSRLREADVSGEPR